MLDIALLGCGGSMPIPERNLTSLLLRYNGKMILIDCGEGTQVSMKILKYGFKHIDVICITHHHADHILGLPGLLATIANSERTEPLIIIGPKGIERIIKGLMVIVSYLPYELKIIENPKEYKLHDLDISTIELEHTSPCLGYKFHIKRSRRFSKEKAIENNVPQKLWNNLQKGMDIIHENKVYTKEMVLGEERKGITVCYITDSRPIETIPSFIYQSDVFICEGTYGADEDIDKAIRNKHMTFSEAAILAKLGEVNKLILTHFSPSLLNPNVYINNARKHFLNSEIGFDRLVENIKFKNDN